MADSPVGPPEDHFAWRYFTGRKDSKRWESALTQAQAFIKAERVEGHCEQVGGLTAQDVAGCRGLLG